MSKETASLFEASAADVSTLVFTACFCSAGVPRGPFYQLVKSSFEFCLVRISLNFCLASDVCI